MVMKQLILFCALMMSFVGTAFAKPAVVVDHNHLPVWDVVYSTDALYPVTYQHNQCQVSVSSDERIVKLVTNDMHYKKGVLTENLYLHLNTDGDVVVAEVSTYYQYIDRPDNHIVAIAFTHSSYNIFVEQCSYAAQRGLPAHIKAAFHGKYGIM
jgi:hypothetical protein